MRARPETTLYQINRGLFEVNFTNVAKIVQFPALHLLAVTYSSCLNNKTSSIFQFLFQSDLRVIFYHTYALHQHLVCHQILLSLFESINLNLPEFIIHLLHKKSHHCILMLAARSLSLLSLLKLLKKAATRLEFVHFIGAKGVCKTFFTNITRCGYLLIELRHLEITTLVSAKDWSHWACIFKMVYQIIERNFLADATPINTSEDETSLHFIFILL